MGQEVFGMATTSQLLASTLGLLLCVQLCRGECLRAPRGWSCLPSR